MPVILDTHTHFHANANRRWAQPKLYLSDLLRLASAVTLL